jgi:hypothetical protein
MSALNKLMGRGLHGLLDYPLAAVLIVLPFVLDFDDGALDRSRHSATPARLRGYHRHGCADRAAFHRRLLEPHDGARVLPRRRRRRPASDARDTLAAHAGRTRDDAPRGRVAARLRRRALYAAERNVSMSMNWLENHANGSDGPMAAPVSRGRNSWSSAAAAGWDARLPPMSWPAG